MDVYLSHSVKSAFIPTIIYLPMNHAFPPLVRMDEHVLVEFINRKTLRDTRILNAELPWSGSPPLIIAFKHRGLTQSLATAIQVGTCTACHLHVQQPYLGSVWANVQGSLLKTFLGDHSHECPSDHVLTWPHLAKEFSMEFADPKALDLDHPRKVRSQWIFGLTFAVRPSSTMYYGHLSLVELRLKSDVLVEGFDF